jgi:hypothetical protein
MPSPARGQLQVDCWQYKAHYTDTSEPVRSSPSAEGEVPRLFSFPITAIAAIAGVCLALSLPLHAQSGPGSATTVTVFVYNFVGVPPGILVAAERHADKILRAAGAKIEWISCPQDNAPDSPEPCGRGWAMQTPGLRLISGANKSQSMQFGYTAIPIYSTIYYERIADRAHRDRADSDLPVLLGCVIAHELGHLLLRSPDHSAKGIMQPVWGTAQVHQALTGNLLFTADQSVRIQNQAHFLASLSRNPAQQIVTP